MQVAQLLPELGEVPSSLPFHSPFPVGRPPWRRHKMRKTSILLALAVVTVQAAGCASCRRWFHRGSPCVGTQIAAPTVVPAPVPVVAPAPIQQVAPAPVMAPAPVQPQYVVPQQPAVCCPQPVPCCPQPVPCCPPPQCCPTPCCPPIDCCDPCPQGAWFGGFVDGECGPVTSYDKGYIEQGTSLDTYSTDPGPAQEE